MRTVSTNTGTEIAKVVTTPGYLVEILFATPLHFCSRSQVTWSGQTWLARDLHISGLGVDGSGSIQNGRLQVGDTDGAMSSLLLLQGVADRTINVWAYYGTGNPGVSDPAQIFSGAGDAWSIDPDQGTVVITLRQASGRTSFAPRRYINETNGFNYLVAAGTVIVFNGENFTLERRKT